LLERELQCPADVCITGPVSAGMDASCPDARGESDVALVGGGDTGGIGVVGTVCVGL
jgi:hypothetical protein